MDLSLSGIKFDGEFLAEDNVVSLPNLRRLDIGNFKYGDCVNLLNFIQIDQAISWKIICETSRQEMAPQELSNRILK